MRAPFALIVNDVAVCEGRPSVLVALGQLAKGEVLDQHSGGIRGTVRAAAQVDQIPDAGNSFTETHCSSWNWTSLDDASVPGAGADRYINGRVGEYPGGDVERRRPSDGATDPTVCQPQSGLPRGPVRDHGAGPGSTEMLRTSSQSAIEAAQDTICARQIRQSMEIW
jgi:hypothetical protein